MQRGPKQFNVGLDVVVPCFWWLVALFNLFLLFALTFSWLGFSDIRAIHDIASIRSALDATNTAVQVVSVGLLFLIAAIEWEEGDSLYKAKVRPRPTIDDAEADEPVERRADLLRGGNVFVRDAILLRSRDCWAMG
jgi:hypothetical protein